MSEGHNVDVEIDPGSLDVFARRVRRLAESWANTDGSAYKVTAAREGDTEWPKLGSFGEAGDFYDAYVNARNGLAENFSQLHSLLEGLAEASERIAENYRSTESLNNAGVQQIEAILGEEMVIDAGEEGPVA